jgi:DnaJ like chaperone protein
MSSIWAWILSGAAGLGGPIGALVRAVAGGGQGGDGQEEAPTRQVAFTIAVIALAAKMAKADGAVTCDEVQAFREIVSFPPEEEQNVRFFFDLARKSTAGFESYAKQVAKLFADNPAVLEKLLAGLFYIAVADGALKPEEDSYLRAVARIFGFDEAAYRCIRATHVSAKDDRPIEDPLQILGLSEGASEAEIKAAYRRLVREHHPDLLIAQGLPAEFIGVATMKLARINAAYDRVLRTRRLA